ncbi:hypothetical protein CYMTET_9932 [Cymbomonas tetramitiformis]|uniref:Uncharacterized protein n=1 Tax=Cymbomonas tetramitiformis TaxID=36881 RepID=A0AAE0CE56_9CHLO|nr:hypothetical protein CYMTET_38096 [Cymbomonas tetramitiformis]KAK3282326.1 hypothetical protein CYMTET_9932 [Cymbomonas tetramitiformis]
MAPVAADTVEAKQMDEASEEISDATVSGAEPRVAAVVVALGSTQKLRGFPVKTPEEFEAEAQVPPAAAADTLDRKVHLMSNLLKGTRNALSRVIAHLAVEGRVSLPRDGDVVREVASAGKLPGELASALADLNIDKDSLLLDEDEDEEPPCLVSDDEDFDDEEDIPLDEMPPGVVDQRKGSQPISACFASRHGVEVHDDGQGQVHAGKMESHAYELLKERMLSGLTEEHIKAMAQVQPVCKLLNQCLAQGMALVASGGLLMLYKVILMDTGANCNIITIKTVKQLGLTIFETGTGSRVTRCDGSPAQFSQYCYVDVVLAAGTPHQTLHRLHAFVSYAEGNSWDFLVGTGPMKNVLKLTIDLYRGVASSEAAIALGMKEKVTLPLIELTPPADPRQKIDEDPRVCLATEIFSKEGGGWGIQTGGPEEPLHAAVAERDMHGEDTSLQAGDGASTVLEDEMLVPRLAEEYDEAYPELASLQIARSEACQNGFTLRPWQGSAVKAWPDTDNNAGEGSWGEQRLFLDKGNIGGLCYLYPEDQQDHGLGGAHANVLFARCSEEKVVLKSRLQWPDFTSVDQKWDVGCQQFTNTRFSRVPDGSNHEHWAVRPDCDVLEERGWRTLARFQNAVNKFHTNPAGDVKGAIMWDMLRCEFCVVTDAYMDILELLKATVDHVESDGATSELNDLQVPHHYESWGCWLFQALKYVEALDMGKLRRQLHRQWKEVASGQQRAPALQLADLGRACKRKFYPVTDGEGGDGEIFTCHHAASEYVQLGEGRKVLKACATREEALYALDHSGQRRPPPPRVRGGVFERNAHLKGAAGPSGHAEVLLSDATAATGAPTVTPRPVPAREPLPLPHHGPPPGTQPNPNDQLPSGPFDPQVGPHRYQRHLDPEEDTTSLDARPGSYWLDGDEMLQVLNKSYQTTFLMSAQDMLGQSPGLRGALQAHYRDVEDRSELINRTLCHLHTGAAAGTLHMLLRRASAQSKAVYYLFEDQVYHREVTPMLIFTPEYLADPCRKFDRTAWMSLGFVAAMHRDALAALQHRLEALGPILPVHRMVPLLAQAASLQLDEPPAEATPGGRVVTGMVEADVTERDDGTTPVSPPYSPTSPLPIRDEGEWSPSRDAMAGPSGEGGLRWQQRRPLSPIPACDWQMPLSPECNLHVRPVYVVDDTQLALSYEALSDDEVSRYQLSASPSATSFDRAMERAGVRPEDELDDERLDALVDAYIAGTPQPSSGTVPLSNNTHGHTDSARTEAVAPAGDITSRPRSPVVLCLFAGMGYTLWHKPEVPHYFAIAIWALLEFMRHLCFYSFERLWYSCWMRRNMARALWSREAAEQWLSGTCPRTPLTGGLLGHALLALSWWCSLLGARHALRGDYVAQADDFYAAAKCCIASYFQDVRFFDLYGPPELLEGQVVYYVPMPSPQDEYDIAAQGWFWGILSAFVILCALTAAVIQFNKHRARTLLQVEVADPFDPGAPEKHALVPVGAVTSNLGGGRVVPLDDTSAPPATPPARPPPSTLSASDAPAPRTPDYTSVAGGPVAESVQRGDETPPASLRLPPLLVHGAVSLEEGNRGIVNMPVPGWSAEISAPNDPSAR